MQTPTFLILAGLAEQPRHGYGIVHRLQRHADAARERLSRRPGIIPGLSRVVAPVGNAA